MAMGQSVSLRHTGPTTVIESVGSTSLVEVGTNFFLDNISTGTGPSLKYGGADVVAGQFGAAGRRSAPSKPQPAMRWPGRTVPVSIRCGIPTATATSSRRPPHMSASSTALESFETSFHQDLNGDGIIGVPRSAYHRDRSRLARPAWSKLGTNFFLDNISTGTGPSLKYGGADVVAGQFGGGWTPIGTEQTATGYEVAWKNAVPVSIRCGTPTATATSSRRPPAMSASNPRTRIDRDQLPAGSQWERAHWRESHRQRHEWKRHAHQ